MTLNSAVVTLCVSRYSVAKMLLWKLTEQTGAYIIRTYRAVKDVADATISFAVVPFFCFVAVVDVSGSKTTGTCGTSLAGLGIERLVLIMIALDKNGTKYDTNLQRIHLVMNACQRNGEQHGKSILTSRRREARWFCSVVGAVLVAVTGDSLVVVGFVGTVGFAEVVVFAETRFEMVGEGVETSAAGSSIAVECEGGVPNPLVEFVAARFEMTAAVGGKCEAGGVMFSRVLSSSESSIKIGSFRTGALATCFFFLCVFKWLLPPSSFSSALFLFI